MYIIFPIRFYWLQWCNGYFASLPRWRPRFDSRRRKYYFVFNLIFPIFYSFCNKSLVAFYIKFNALAKSSHQPHVFCLYIYIYIYIYKFSNPNRIITVMVTDLRLCQFVVRILPNLCSHFLSQSFHHTPLKILVSF